MNSPAAMGARAWIWCDKRATATTASRWFQNRLAAVKSGPEVSVASPIGEVFKSSVQLGDVSFQFFSIDSVTKFRSMLSLPTYCSLALVELGLPYDLQKNFDMSPLETTLDHPRMMALSVLQHPDLTTCLSLRSSHTFPQRLTSESLTSSFQVAEFAVGLPEDVVSQKVSILRQQAFSSPSPSLFSLTSSTFVRLLPAKDSTIVLRPTTNNPSLHHILNLTPIGRGEEFMLNLPELPGLNLRITTATEPRAHFYECPTTNEEDCASFGNSLQSANVSCKGVTGMEARSRMLQAPTRMFRKFLQAV